MLEGQRSNAIFVVATNSINNHQRQQHKTTSHIAIESFFYMYLCQASRNRNWSEMEMSLSLLQEKHHSAQFYFYNCKLCFSSVCLSAMEADVSGEQVEESWHWTYPTSSWLMTCSRSRPTMSRGAEQSLKGFSKWLSHAWRWWGDRTAGSAGDTMDVWQWYASCTTNPKFHL